MIMTIEDKVNEIIDDFKKAIDTSIPDTLNNEIIRCAITAVDMLMGESKEFWVQDIASELYWKEIKKELKNRYD